MGVYRIFLYGSIILFAACQLPAEKRAKKVEERISDNTQLQVTDTNHAVDTNVPVIPLPVEKKIKNPRGIYQVHLPIEGGVEHTVAFNSNNTFQLQETFKNDSTVVSTGTWAPSDGYIWLYKEQVVRARYKWSDNQLQYYSPVLKKNWGMKHLEDVLQNKVWLNKKSEGVMVYAIGNEPFWNAEISNKDSMAFRLMDWPQALKLKINTSQINSDSLVFTAQNDTASLKILVLPYFCSDGMSDMIYKNKIRVYYNNKLYSGCGVNYQ